MHLKNKENNKLSLRRAKKDSKKDNTIHVASYDLEKILTTPQAEIGPLYYMSKLNVWNFTIYDLTAHNGYCYLWNKTVGKRGSTEIASYLMNYYYKVLQDNPNITEIRTFSDNCGGQNKNQNVFSMNLLLATKLKIKIRQT